MAIQPSHGILDDDVQIPERVSFGHLNMPPDWRVLCE